MARYSRAVWKPLPQNSTQPKIKPVGVVLHTAVSDSTSLWNFFNGRSAGVESHFYIREDGTVEQYMDTEVRADCQLDGNSWLKGGTRYGFVSIETWDGGRPDTTPWNAKQLTALVDLITWLTRTHGFSPVLATGPQGYGIGYHAQFTDRASDPAPSWNHSHSCPAKLRVAQVPLIIARVRANLAQSPASTNAPTTPEVPLAAGIPARLVQVPGDAAIYVIGLDGRAYHVPNAVALAQGRKAGYYSNQGRPNAITRSDLNKILVK